MVAQLRTQSVWKRTRFAHSLNLFHDAETGSPLALVVRGVFLPPVCLAQEEIRLEIEAARNHKVSSTLECFVNAILGIDVEHAGIVDIPWLRTQFSPDAGVDELGYRRIQLGVEGEYIADKIDLPLQSHLRIKLKNADSPSLDILDIPLWLVSTGSDEIIQTPDRIACGVMTRDRPFEVDVVARWRTATGFNVQDIATGPHVKYSTQQLSKGEYTHYLMRCVISPLDTKRPLADEISLVIANGHVTRKVTWPVSGFVKDADDEVRNERL